MDNANKGYSVGWGMGLNVGCEKPSSCNKYIPKYVTTDDYNWVSYMFYLPIVCLHRF